MVQQEDQLLPLPPKQLIRQEVIEKIIAKQMGNSIANRSEFVQKDMKAIRNIAKKLQIPLFKKDTNKTVDLSKNKLVNSNMSEASAAVALVGERIGLSKSTLKQIRKTAEKLNVDTGKLLTHRVKPG